MLTVKQIGQGRQAGFSLVEFLIAMTVGLFLLAGMATVFSTTNISYNSQSNLAQLQNNQLLAMNVLSNVIQSAGYYANPQGQTFLAALPASVVQAAALPANIKLYNSANGTHLTPLSTAPTLIPSFAAVAAGGQAITGGSLYNGGPDVVAVRSQGAMDCSGATTNNAGHPTVSVFTVSNGYLLCTTYDSQTVGYPNNWLVLVNNVSRMDVYYGFDPNATGSATEYVSASNVTAWNEVLSVRIMLSLVNPNAAMTGQSANLSFTRVIGLMGVL